MKDKIKNKVSAFVFGFWTKVSPSLSEKYQYFDTRMLRKNEMSSDFPWKKYEKQKNLYFKKWGFDVSQMDLQLENKENKKIAEIKRSEKVLLYLL